MKFQNGVLVWCWLPCSSSREGCKMSLFVVFLCSNGPGDGVCFSRAVVAVVITGQWSDGCCAACSACQRCMFSRYGLHPIYLATACRCVLIDHTSHDGDIGTQKSQKFGDK